MPNRLVSLEGKGMALTAFCTTCQRTVYFEAECSLVCPVCSSPLVSISDEHEGVDSLDSATRSFEQYTG
jgi:Zn finger protein HypA/HybF involved in hydrogenase expression